MFKKFPRFVVIRGELAYTRNIHALLVTSSRCTLHKVASCYEYITNVKQVHLELQRISENFEHVQNFH